MASQNWNTIRHMGGKALKFATVIGILAGALEGIGTAINAMAASSVRTQALIAKNDRAFDTALDGAVEKNSPRFDWSDVDSSGHSTHYYRKIIDEVGVTETSSDPSDTYHPSKIKVYYVDTNAAGIPDDGSVIKLRTIELPNGHAPAPAPAPKAPVSSLKPIL